MIPLEQFKSKIAIRSQQSTGLVYFLEQSELWMLELMAGNGCPPGTTQTPLAGDVECGLFPYWLNNPPVGLGLDGYLKAIVDAFGITTQITTSQYNCFMSKVKSGAIVGVDGTLYADSSYASLDVRWLYCVLNWFIHDDPPQFPTSPQTVAIIPKTSGGDVVIAIVGDWGAGNYDSATGPASAVMDAIMTWKPDAIVHLGDVYYSGTPSNGVPAWYSMYAHPGEEAANLTGLWPKGVTNSFTLNSNHEMCSAGNAYFPTIASGPFQQQKGTSYFALTVAGWTILGLDTAYNADCDSLYMTGNLNQAQCAWITSMRKNDNLTAGKVIVLSHHNGLTYDGCDRATASDTSLGSTLWDQINGALGGDPAAWYWGHIHDGIAYSYPAPGAPAPPPGTPPVPVNTYARCVGHGSIPYGNAFGLTEAGVTGNLTYYAHTPDPNHTSRVYNGYVILSIASDGTVTEQFCDVSPAATPTQTAQYGFRTS